MREDTKIKGADMESDFWLIIASFFELSKHIGCSIQSFFRDQVVIPDFNFVKFAVSTSSYGI